MSSAVARVWGQRASIVRFLSTGVAGALLNIGVFVVLAHALGADYRVAIVVSFALSYLFSFLAHRNWTFSATDGHAGHQGARFVVVSAVSTGFALVVAVAVVEGLGLPKNVGAVTAGVLTAPLSFLLHREYTFRAEQPSPDAPSGWLAEE